MSRLAPEMSSATPTQARSGWLLISCLSPSHSTGWSSTTTTDDFFSVSVIAFMRFLKRRLRFQRRTAANGGPFTRASLDFARAADALCSIAHDSKPHAVAVRLGVKALTVIVYGQDHVSMPELELDQHLASSTMLHSVADRFLSNPVKLSRDRPTDWARCAVCFNRALDSATFTDVHGQRFQCRFQISHAVSAFEAPGGESRLPGRFISESHDRRRLVGFERPVCPQLFFKQLGAQGYPDELLPYSVVQVIGNSSLFAGATLDHLTFEPRALRHFSLKECGFLLPEPFKFTALLLRQHLCFFSRRNVQADSSKPLRVAFFVHLYAPTRTDPLHTAVPPNKPKLGLVIFALFDRVVYGLPDFVAIVFVRTGNQLFECDPSSRRKTQLDTARRGNPDFIFFQIPLPHSDVGGVRREVESFLAGFQFTRELPRS